MGKDIYGSFIISLIKKLLFFNLALKFFSEKFVKISSNEEVLCGEGFQANQNFNNWKIRKIRNSYVNLKDE